MEATEYTEQVMRLIYCIPRYNDEYFGLLCVLGVLYGATAVSSVNRVIVP